MKTLAGSIAVLFLVASSPLQAAALIDCLKAVVREPALALRWVDHGKNNVFLGRFGEGTTAPVTFTPPALMCTVADRTLHE